MLNALSYIYIALFLFSLIDTPVKPYVLPLTIAILFLTTLEVF